MKMKMTRALGVVAAVVAVQACATAAPPMAMSGSSDDEQAILAMVESIETAWNAKDVAAMTGMIAADYHGLSSEGTLTSGLAAYEAMLTEDFAEERPEGMMLSLEPGYLHWHGADTASVGGTWSVSGLPAGAPGSNGSHLLVVTRQDDANWKISNVLVSQFVPEPPADGEMGG